MIINEDFPVPTIQTSARWPFHGYLKEKLLAVADNQAFSFDSLRGKLNQLKTHVEVKNNLQAAVFVRRLVVSWVELGSNSHASQGQSSTTHSFVVYLPEQSLFRELYLH